MITLNFPLNDIKKFILYDTNRWDLITKSEKVIKLPKEKYIKSLKNYLKMSGQSNFKEYKVFDYRINNQLILKNESMKKNSFTLFVEINKSKLYFQLLGKSTIIIILKLFMNLKNF